MYSAMRQVQSPYGQVLVVYDLAFHLVESLIYLIPIGGKAAALRVRAFQRRNRLKRHTRYGVISTYHLSGKKTCCGADFWWVHFFIIARPVLQAQVEAVHLERSYLRVFYAIDIFASHAG